jgi:hypothetical protein
MNGAISRSRFMTDATVVVMRRACAARFAGDRGLQQAVL